MADQSSAVSFTERLAHSQAFADLFRDGMALVEETATYLDGPGRKESRALGRTGSLTYATESMRLTTRLMQLASWLLLHRAVREGEMSLAQVNAEKTKVRLTPTDLPEVRILDNLPEALTGLIRRGKVLHDQVLRLDNTIHSPPTADMAQGNPVEKQLGMLKAAFEANRA